MVTLVLNPYLLEQSRAYNPVGHRVINCTLDTLYLIGKQADLRNIHMDDTRVSDDLFKVDL